MAFPNGKETVLSEADLTAETRRGFLSAELPGDHAAIPYLEILIHRASPGSRVDVRFRKGVLCFQE